MIRYFKTIILSETPLTTLYRYKDRFQIYPIEQDALLCPHAKHYPLYLEYSVDVDESLRGDALGVVTLNEEKELARLLTLFTSYHFFFYTGYQDRWGLLMPPLPLDKLSQEQKELYINNQISSWSISVIKTKYHKYEYEIPHFTDTQCQPMPLVPDSDSYFKLFAENEIVYRDLNIKNESLKIVFPQSIDECLTMYYALSKEHKKIIRSAIYLSYDGIEIVRVHKALGFFALAAALDGLTKLFTTSYPEITKKGHKKYKNKEDCLVKMLSAYHSNKIEDITLYKEFYNTRCNVAHDNILFTLDYGVTLDEKDFSPSEDWFKTLNILMCLRHVITNLLLDKEKIDWIPANK